MTGGVYGSRSDVENSYELNLFARFRKLTEQSKVGSMETAILMLAEEVKFLRQVIINYVARPTTSSCMPMSDVSDKVKIP